LAQDILITWAYNIYSRKFSTKLSKQINKIRCKWLWNIDFQCYNS